MADRINRETENEMPDLETTSEPDAPEVKLLIEAIRVKYGYDFRNYAEASFKRRIGRALSKYGCENIAAILHRTLTDPDFFSTLLNDLTITVTEMFRDPKTYRAIRDQVFPYLRTYPEIKIWFAGCSGGEEVYSLAILLMEEGLYERAILYGTDINPSALKRAKKGILDIGLLKEATQRYFEAGGNSSLHTYYTTSYGAALLDHGLRKNVVFSDHNLVSDGVFGEMQLIFCRNTLIYFKRELHDRAIGLFENSLCPGGFLCLGSKEGLSVSTHRDAFEEFSRSARVYRKKKDQGR
jgi:chemotaxis protein methyltransferase CheR